MLIIRPDILNDLATNAIPSKACSI